MSTRTPPLSSPSGTRIRKVKARESEAGGWGNTSKSTTVAEATILAAGRVGARSGRRGELVEYLLSVAHREPGLFARLLEAVLDSEAKAGQNTPAKSKPR
jgi:hypothetical protein